MADNKQYITRNQETGSVMISEDVICTIVSRAVEEVEGVAGFSNTNKKNWGKGLKVSVDDSNKLTVDCNINVVYGQSIVNIASSVQEAAAAAILSMTGIYVTAINVNICGIIRK